jgi:hypothetical protein
MFETFTKCVILEVALACFAYPYVWGFFFH